MFAEGAAAPRFDSFYLLLNPNQTPITVRGRFLPESGMPMEKVMTMAPRSRSTIYLNGEFGNVGGVASTFTSDTLPFLAERSIYWGAGRVEGTNVIGASAAASEWHFPEGSSGGQFDTYLLLANPGSHDATVRLTLFIEGVGRFTASQPELLRTVRAGQRLTIYMNDFLTALETAEGRPVGSLRGKSFSTRVNVLSGDPVVAEEAIYWQRDGANFWRAARPLSVSRSNRVHAVGGGGAPAPSRAAGPDRPSGVAPIQLSRLQPIDWRVRPPGAAVYLQE